MFGKLKKAKWSHLFCSDKTVIEFRNISTQPSNGGISKRNNYFGTGMLEQLAPFL
jgi:hypothetical protein